MPTDQCRIVVDKIDPLLAFHIGDAAAPPRAGIDRIRIHHDRVTGIPTGHHRQCPVIELFRFRLTVQKAHLCHQSPPFDLITLEQPEALPETAAQNWSRYYSRSITILPCSSRPTLELGGTRHVASYSSIMHGPLRVLCKAARSRTGTSNQPCSGPR